MRVNDFVDELSSDSPAPGGGSVSALAASMAAGLAAMVAVLSHTRKGFESKQTDLDRIAVRAQTLKDQLLTAVDADTAAFDQLLDAMRMPKSRVRLDMLKAITEYRPMAAMTRAPAAKNESRAVTMRVGPVISRTWVSMVRM